VRRCTKAGNIPDVLHTGSKTSRPNALRIKKAIGSAHHEKRFPYPPVNVVRPMPGVGSAPSETRGMGSMNHNPEGFTYGGTHPTERGLPRGLQSWRRLRCCSREGQRKARRKERQGFLGLEFCSFKRRRRKIMSQSSCG
jgi:hypothetical protein